VYYIGIDLGTSAVKLLLMRSDGGIERIVSKDYPLSMLHTGWSEQNPKDWYNKTIEGLKELVSGYPADEIKGIGAGGQMHGLVLLDKDDEVIRPAILWNDSRATKENDYLNNEIGQDKLGEYTANMSFTGFTAPKLLWVRNNEPENWEKIAKIMLPKDYMIYRLSGSFATDVSDASGTLYFDVRNRRWSKEMLDICGITEEMLPKVYESYEKVGTIKPSLAEDIGVSKDCVMAAGAGDNAAAAIGTGTVGEGACNISLGTSGTIFIASSAFPKLENHAVHSFCHADGNYHIMGCILSATSSLKWWMKNIIESEDYNGEQARIKELGTNSVFFLPYLTGERSPHNDPYARGTFIGMTPDSTREDMTLAVLEGVAFALRDSLEIAKAAGVNVSRSMISGGGANSIIWKEILANVMDVSIDVPESEQGPGLGGAILAAVAAGEYTSVEQLSHKVVRIVDTIEPKEKLREKYEEKYNQYRLLYPRLKEAYKIL